MEAKVWPRTCAVAERLWSEPLDTTWKEAEPRILEQRRRMAVFRNIRADAVQPEFCRQNDGFCYPIISNQLNFGVNPPHDNGDKGNDVPLHLRNYENKEVGGKLINSEGQFLEKLQGRHVRNINEVIQWTVFVVVLLILVMVKRRLVCAVVLKIVEYCRTIAEAGGPNGPGMRMINIR